MKFGKKPFWVRFYKKKHVSHLKPKNGSHFSRRWLYGILVLKKKIKTQLKIAHLTRQNVKTNQNDKREY